MPGTVVLNRTVDSTEEMTARQRGIEFRRRMKQIVVVAASMALLALAAGGYAYTQHTESMPGSAFLMFGFMMLVSLGFIPVVHQLVIRASRYRKQPKHRMRSKSYRLYRLFMLRKLRARR